MSWTKEMEMFKLLADAGGADIFLKIDNNENSYWVDASNDNEYIREYGFESPIELIDELNRFGLKKYSKLLATSTFKNKNKLDKKEGKMSEDTSLPTFVYNF